MFSLKEVPTFINSALILDFIGLYLLEPRHDFFWL